MDLEQGFTLQDRSYRLELSKGKSSPLSKIRSKGFADFAQGSKLDNSGDDFLSKRIVSNNLMDYNFDERKRRASNYVKNSNNLSKSYYEGSGFSSSSKSNIKTTLRRSFMDAQDVRGIRKSSVNKKPKEEEDMQGDDDNNSIGTDYSDDDMKDIEYHQRNKELYKILKRIGVCVIPDPRIKTADHLPYFAIIQDDIRDR